MKWILLLTATAVLSGSTASACPTLGGRLATRVKTVTTTKTTVELKPKTVVVEKTVLVPTKVKTTETKLVPTKTTTATSRTTVRGKIRETLPCPGCK